MKKLFLFFVIVLSASFAQAAAGWLGDYSATLAKAQKIHKPIVMMYSAEH
ncbi:MAG: hypothetical protein HF962_01450 [Sulfurovum sp.]|nr:hypothetical protein [Sulfurovum sp.]